MFTHPSPFRSTTATSYPKEDARPGPCSACSTESLAEASLSFFNRTTAPLWLALGAPATTVRPRLLVMLCPESRENPKVRVVVGHKIKNVCHTEKHTCFLPNFEYQLPLMDRRIFSLPPKHKLIRFLSSGNSSYTAYGNYTVLGKPITKGVKFNLERKKKERKKKTQPACCSSI